MSGWGGGTTGHENSRDYLHSLHILFVKYFRERERERDREGAKLLTDGLKMMSAVCVMKNTGKFDVKNVKSK